MLRHNQWDGEYSDPICVFQECRGNARATDKTFILPDLFLTYSLLVISMEIYQCFQAETSQVHSDPIFVFQECWGHARATNKTFILPDPFLTYSPLVISMEIYQSFHAETCQVHSDTRYVCSENAEGMPELLTKHLYCLICSLPMAFLRFQWKHTNVPMPRPAKCTLTRMCVPRMPSESRSYWQHIYTTWSLFSLYPSWDFNGNIPMCPCRDRPSALQPKCVFRECWVNPGVTNNTFILPDPFLTYILLVISMEICQYFHAETGQGPSDLICVFWECQGNARVTDNTFILPDLTVNFSLLVMWKA